MSFPAFDAIMTSLMEALDGQGFSDPKPFDEDGAVCEMTVSGDVAYGLKYHKNKKQFELCSTTVDEEGNPEKWRSLSVWLFDEEEGTKSDLESIKNDFVEVVRGPKRVAMVQKKKKNKDEEKNIDPQFFFNRLVNFFPELRDEINDEKIVYGQVRSITFAKGKVAPKCEAYAVRYKGQSSMEKLGTLFSDMYANGDLDLRAVITSAILNNMSQEAFLALNEHFSDELKTDTKYTRKLIGKNIKPEKKKKEKKVVARLDQ